MRPPQVSKLQEAPMALLKWDGYLRECLEAGGKTPNFEDRRAALLIIPSTKFKEEVFCRIPAMQESMTDASAEDQDKAYFALRAQLQKQVDMTIQWSSIGGGFAGGSGANVLPEEQGSGGGADGVGQGDSGPEDYEAFLAWRAKGKSKGKGKDPKGKGKDKEPICVNCAEKGHTIGQCTKEIVPMKDRPCLKCRK